MRDRPGGGGFVPAYGGAAPDCGVASDREGASLLRWDCDEQCSRWYGFSLVISSMQTFWGFLMLSTFAVLHFSLLRRAAAVGFQWLCLWVMSGVFLMLSTFAVLHFCRARQEGAVGFQCIWPCSCLLSVGDVSRSCRLWSCPTRRNRAIAASFRPSFGFMCCTSREVKRACCLMTAVPFGELPLQCLLYL